MKKSRYPIKGAAPREEKTAPNGKSVIAWCEHCKARRTAFAGQCTVCGGKTV